MTAAVRTARTTAAIKTADPGGQLTPARGCPNPCPHLVEVHPRHGLRTAVVVASGSNRRHSVVNTHLVYVNRILRVCHSGRRQLGSLSSGSSIEIPVAVHTKAIEQLHHWKMRAL